MTEALPAGPSLVAFLLASFVLAVTPGPGVLYIVTRSMAEGRAGGIASVAGVALGNLGNAIGASIGLAALFAVSQVAFTVVRYAGAAYLVYLGIQALRAPALVGGPIEPACASRMRITRDGFLVALLNPKTAMFFAAFLPQFMRPDHPAMAQSALLGVIFVAIAATTDSLYAIGASGIAPTLARSRMLRVGSRYLTGATFLGLGLLSALGSARTVK
jgi:threonine/homoserine/homoserine lactone efflux protein